MSTAAQILKEAQAVLAAGEVDPSISKADTISALAALLAQVDESSDGGSAFPTGAHIGDMGVTEGGISVRDYFAAHAPITVEDALLLTGLSAHSIGMLRRTERARVLEGLAVMRGDYADAMLRERAK